MKSLAYFGKDPLKTIALIGKCASEPVAHALLELMEALSRRGLELLVEQNTAQHLVHPSPRFSSASYADIGERAELAIVIGGDGTMLSAARHLAAYKVPLVGINQGRLGFMTDVARNDMLPMMDTLLSGGFLPEVRMLLEAKVYRGRRKIAEGLALNEVVVDKGAMGRLIEFSLVIDEEFVYDLRADGVIISTPTGSTAYSLSANGPILHPRVPGLAVVPLCPHSLTNRPILIGDRSRVEIELIHATESRAHFDGQVTLDLHAGDRIRIQRSRHEIYFLHPPGYSYFAMLRQKLHWSETPRRYLASFPEVS